LLQVRALLETGLRIRVDTIRTLDGMCHAQRDEALLALRERAFREDRAVPVGKFLPQIGRALPHFGEARQAFVMIVPSRQLPPVCRVSYDLPASGAGVFEGQWAHDCGVLFDSTLINARLPFAAGR